MKFEEKLRELRIQRNLSQEYMANALGIDTSNYSRLERGLSEISLPRMEKIAQVLRMDLIDLLAYPESFTQYKTQVRNDFVQHLQSEIAFLRKQLSEKDKLLMQHLGQRNPAFVSEPHRRYPDARSC